jgi:hypothetical protein
MVSVTPTETRVWAFTFKLLPKNKAVAAMLTPKRLKPFSRILPSKIA